MPYIKAHKRPKYESLIEQLVQVIEDAQPGDLNYILFAACRQYLADHKEYSNIKSILGELQLCWMELWWRELRPLEDLKILENGDV